MRGSENAVGDAQRELIERAYAAFNARDIDAVLDVLHPDVEWANGMEGGSVHGHDGVRAYWRRQWTMIDPRVDPVRIVRNADGSFVVDVHQVVRDLDGTVVADRVVQHVYVFEHDLVRSMRIRE